MTLTLEWPGELNISYVVIDPATKRVFSSDLPLPTDCQKLNTFENRYVKINDIFDLFSGQVQDDAKWVLQELLERFNVKQLVNVASKVSESSAYLPMTTLLAFAMIWPCCKAFQSLCKAIQQFLESSSEALCNQCGWTKRECYCKGKYSVDNIKAFLGYIKSSSDASCQTDFVPDTFSENVSTLNSGVNYTCVLKDGETSLISDMQQGTANTIENDDNIAKPISSNITESLNSSTNQNTSLNYVQPLTPTTSTSDSSKDCPAQNVYNLTYHGFHDVNSRKKRKEPNFHQNEAPRQKKMKLDYNNDYEEFNTRNGIHENDRFMSIPKCSAGIVPGLTSNARGHSDKSGESNFWVPVDESDPDDGKTIGRFRHIVFDDVMIRCLIQDCRQCFETEKSAELHERTHVFNNSIESHRSGLNGNDLRTSNYYKCLKCAYRSPFGQWFGMLRHMETTHGLSVSSNDPNSCGMCGLDFDDQESLERHIEFHSNSHYRCMHCGINLFSWNQVQMHMEMCNRRSANMKDKKIDMGCPYCTSLFQKRDIRSIHLRSHSDLGFACMFCMDKTFTAWKALKKHYDTKHPKQIKRFGGSKASKKVDASSCFKCNLKFRNSEVYADHMAQIHRLMPVAMVMCDQCNRHFNTERSLNFHMKEVHAPEIPCDKCPYVATSAGLLKVHMNRKHSSDYTCSQCNATFPSHRQLRMHTARHALNVIDELSGQHHNHDHPDGLEVVLDSYSGFGINQRSANKIQMRKPQIREEAFGDLLEPDFIGEYKHQLPTNEDRIPNGKRGRRRKGAIDANDAKEKLARQQRELVDKMRGLLRDTSARTRTFKDSSTIRSLNIDFSENHDESRLPSSPSTTSATEEVTIMPSLNVNQYPYVDHSYCKLQPTLVKEIIFTSTPAVVNKNVSRPGKKNKSMLRALSPVRPETPSSESCTSFPLRTTRRQAAKIAHQEQFSYCYAPPDMDSSIVAVHNPLDGFNLYSTDAKMNDVERASEFHLQDCNFMHDMLASFSPCKNRNATPIDSFNAPGNLEIVESYEMEASLMQFSDQDLEGFLENCTESVGAMDNFAFDVTDSNHIGNGVM